MSTGSHPTAEPEALMVDDHGDETELDLAPVLDRVMEAMQQKAAELGQATKSIVDKYREDTIKLNECVATELEPPQRASGLDACACPAQADRARARAARAKYDPDAARPVSPRKLHPRDQLLDRLARARGRLHLDASRPSLREAATRED